MKKQSKTFLFFFLLTGFLLPVFANPAKSVNEFTLENGLTVFLLEDSSDALIHVEVDVRAGFSYQTKENTGFFTLYTQILSNLNPSLNFTAAECNSDVSKYAITTTNINLEQQLTDLAQLIYNPQFSDEEINFNLAELKTQVSENVKSMSYLINSAIDSKVFSQSPWKHDSGIYPALFKNSTIKKARTYLSDIQNTCYTPQNSALFISGNINTETVTTLIKNTFGKYYSSVQSPSLPKHQSVNNQKKYVIHDEEFSKELTQVVVQYTCLNMDQADILATALNNKYSTFKNKVLELTDLNIPGDEYINVAQAFKQNNSRLIFQTLIQEPENKKIKTNSFLQVQNFVNQITDIPQTIQQQEFQIAKNQLNYNMNQICNSSSFFMENLSAFWVIQPYINYYSIESTEEIISNSITAAKMMSRLNYLSDTDFSQTLQNFSAEEPYVFVIINSADFKKNKKEYIQNGFTEVTSKNSSWYTQQMYKNISDEFKPDFNTAIYNSRNSIDNEYYKKNLSSMNKAELSNGISVITKQNNNSSGLAILINVKGGKYESANNNGFEEVMVNILGSLIQKELYSRQINGLILGAPEVSTNTDLFTSQIIIECDLLDFEAVSSGISKALIYSEIPPAIADRAVSNRQYKKRLENGSSVSQMTSAIIEFFFPNSPYTQIFETKNEILQNTTYTEILAAYPALLNAAKYDFIICGDFSDSQYLINTLEKNFAQLEQNQKLFTGNTPELQFSKKKKNVKINHTFLTDIPAEKAGPMPAVLIPTTEFLDPVIFCIKAPDDKTSSPVFYAVLNYLKYILEQEISTNKRMTGVQVQIKLPTPRMNYGTIIFTNVPFTKETDSSFVSAVQSLKEKLSYNPQSEINKIKNYWTLTQLAQTATNRGTASLLQKGFEFFPENPKPEFYLWQNEKIQKATIQDFQQILAYFPDIPEFRIYSKEAK